MQETYDSNIHGIMQMPVLTNFYAFAESTDKLSGAEYSIRFMEATASLLTIVRLMNEYKFNEFVKPVSLAPDRESNTRLAFVAFVLPFVLDMIKTKANLNGVRSVSRGLGSHHFDYKSTLDPNVSSAISNKIIEELNQQNISYCTESSIESLEEWASYIAKTYFVRSAQHAIVESDDYTNNASVRGLLRNVLGLIPKTLEFGTLKPCVENCNRITEDLLGFTEMIAEPIKDTGVLDVYKETVNQLKLLCSLISEQPDTTPEAAVWMLFDSALST